MADPPEIEEEEAPPDPRALPNPSGLRVYSVDQGGAHAKPHRPLHLLTKDRQLPRDFETRAPFVPGVTQELPVQTGAEQIAQVHADIDARVQELEEMLDNAELAETTRGAILLEISRLRAAAP